VQYAWHHLHINQICRNEACIRAKSAIKRGPHLHQGPSQGINHPISHNLQLMK
jgi:hypothetical protein